MSCNALRAVCSLLFIALITFPILATATTEYGTFESFYKESSHINWWLAGIFAFVAAAMIIFTGATASPVVLSAGTWVGNMMGLSGAAATNAGLALLGGGSIASGGFGIIGGTALLTAALSFSTDIVIDLSIGEGISRYDYAEFAEQSSSMVTLPLPKNDNGTKTYKVAMKELEEIDENKSVFDSENQAIIQKVVLLLERENTLNHSDPELLREYALLALLKMLQNDYRGAKTASLAACNAAERSKLIATFPAFIYATSLVYDENPDFDEIYKYFAYAVTEEQVNKLRPLLFGIMLDRIAYRISQGFLPSKVLKQLYELTKQYEYGEDKAAIQQLILSRYFMQIKLEQQKITTLTHSESKTIRNSHETLNVVKAALSEYKNLLVTSEDIINDQHSIIMEHENDWWLYDWEEEWASINDSNRLLWSSYNDGTFTLSVQVLELAIIQNKVVLLAIVVFVVVLVLLIRIKHYRKTV